MTQLAENNIIPWLDDTCDALLRSLTRERLGHALLLSGPAGVGKRALALWLCGHYLRPDADQPTRPVWPGGDFRHPDLLRIEPQEGKTRISVEQIRTLVADLGLTSHAGGGKAAIVEPANAMTLSAANSLLKTLEEPPGDALMVLVADTLSGMPATVRSRCAVIRVPLPPASIALGWLQNIDAEADWPEALASAGGAPLRALGWVRAGAEELPSQLRGDLEAVVGGRMGPLDSAGRWAKLDTAFVLDWLERLTRDLIRRRLAGSGYASARVIPESVLEHMDSRNLFCYLDRLTRLRNQPAGSYNVQLALESLLIPWAEGFTEGDEEPHRWPLGEKRAANAAGR